MGASGVVHRSLWGIIGTPQAGHRVPEGWRVPAFGQVLATPKAPTRHQECSGEGAQ